MGMDNTTTTCEICESTIPNAHIGACPRLMGNIKPLADDIPLKSAWKLGRRVYVRCGYRSRLNSQLRDLGAKWDRNAEALWVGSGKAEQVIPLVQAQAERVAQVEDVKAGGRWVKIPYDAVTIRDQAKRLGARWDRERKEWAMPADDALAEVQEAVKAWEAERNAKRAARRQADQRPAEDVIAASGRTVTGERGKAEGRLTGPMKRPQAEEAKPQPGEIRRLKDGTRVLVLASRVDFWSQDAIEDFAPGNEAGWWWTYDYVPVAPNEQEQAEDAKRQAEADEEVEIGAVYAAAVRAAHRREEGEDESPELARIKAQTIAGSIVSDGRMGRGTVTLTTDGEARWFHPGTYDDYRTSEGHITDAAVIARLRAVIDGGSRRRGSCTVRKGK